MPVVIVGSVLRRIGLVGRVLPVGKLLPSLGRRGLGVMVMPVVVSRGRGLLKAGPACRIVAGEGRIPLETACHRSLGDFARRKRRGRARRQR